MPFKDLREFIDKLEAVGESQRIEEEVDWNLEAGAIVRKANENGLPSPFFQRIKGYPDGYRVFGTPLGRHRRLAVAMGLAADTPPRTLIEEYLKRRKQPIKPVIVSNGPCKENILIGDEVDLFKFPVPMVHQGDGGRYIGTFHTVIVKDMNSDWVNWSMQRLMAHDKNSVGILAAPQTHLGMIYYRGYEPANKPMEVAIAIGTEPVSSMLATTPIPYGVSEADIAGGVRGKPVELVKCETISLAVPATSEIVLEGEMLPHERRDEGPFGEYTGYMVSHRSPKPVIHIKAVTYRNNPILTMTCKGVPVDDGHAIISVAQSAEFLEALREQGMPVTGVWTLVQSANMLAIVAVKVPYANVAGEIANIIWSTRLGRSTPFIIIVEDDVDLFNMDEVVHALMTKCHPYRGIVRMEHTVGSSLMPWASRFERENQIGGRAYFDCTFPKTWPSAEMPKKVSLATIYPPEVQQKASAVWQKYGH